MSLVFLRRQPVLVVAVALAALTFAAPYIGIPIGLATQIAIYALYATAVNLLFAYCGLATFGAAVFFGTSGYAIALFLLHGYTNEFVGLIVSILFTLVVGTAIGAFVPRRRGLYYALLTLALSQLAFEIAFKWTSLTGGENGLQDVPRPHLADPYETRQHAIHRARRLDPSSTRFRPSRPMS